MNREILFRGKTEPDGHWVYGSLYSRRVVGGWLHWITYQELADKKNDLWSECETRVKSETVGQYTGVTDKGKNKVFEGDLYRSDSGYIFEVVYLESEACFVGVPVKEPESWVFLEDVLDMKRVGNKWDNPELLEVLDDEA